MKTLLTLTIIALLCGCANDHTLVIRDYDIRNNRVDEHGQLVPWTNWSAGFYSGSNFIKVFQAVEPEK